MINIRIESLRGSTPLEETLVKDGWELYPEPDQALFALHPEVSNEFEARQRLWRLGLLTSCKHRIEFQRS